MELEIQGKETEKIEGKIDVKLELIDNFTPAIKKILKDRHPNTFEPLDLD